MPKQIVIRVLLDIETPKIVETRLMQEDNTLEGYGVNNSGMMLIKVAADKALLFLEERAEQRGVENFLDNLKAAMYKFAVPKQ